MFRLIWSLFLTGLIANLLVILLIVLVFVFDKAVWMVILGSVIYLLSYVFVGFVMCSLLVAYYKGIVKEDKKFLK